MKNQMQAPHSEVPVHEVENLESVFKADAFCDFGGKCCADGPIEEIAAVMRRLEPGQTLEVRATHASVRADLAPWSRLTGHELVQQQDDRYLLRRGG